MEEVLQDVWVLLKNDKKQDSEEWKCDLDFLQKQKEDPTIQQPVDLARALVSMNNRLEMIQKENQTELPGAISRVNQNREILERKDEEVREIEAQDIL